MLFALLQMHNFSKCMDIGEQLVSEFSCIAGLVLLIVTYHIIFLLVFIQHRTTTTR